jgi:hypothetical protein
VSRALCGAMAAGWRLSVSAAAVQLTRQKHRSASPERDDFMAAISKTSLVRSNQIPPPYNQY